MLLSLVVGASVGVGRCGVGSEINVSEVLDEAYKRELVGNKISDYFFG